jgi:hypothetical protein
LLELKSYLGRVKWNVNPLGKKVHVRETCHIQSPLTPNTKQFNDCTQSDRSIKTKSDRPSNQISNSAMIVGVAMLELKKTDRMKPMQQLPYDWSGDRVRLMKG